VTFAIVGPSVNSKIFCSDFIEFSMINFFSQNSIAPKQTLVRSKNDEFNQLHRILVIDGFPTIIPRMWPNFFFFFFKFHFHFVEFSMKILFSLFNNSCVISLNIRPKKNSF
jgi:hypothetical protein